MQHNHEEPQWHAEVPEASEASEESEMSEASETSETSEGVRLSETSDRN